MCLTNFDVYSLNLAGGFRDVDVVIMLWIGDDSEDLGGQLDRAAPGVFRFGSLTGGLVKSRAVACEFGEAVRIK
jgi:hypothetical protein